MTAPICTRLTERLPRISPTASRDEFAAKRDRPWRAALALATGALLLCVAGAKGAEPAPAWSEDMPERAARYVEAAGLRTRYFSGGRGPALVLVHGGQPSSTEGSAWDWQQNFRELARHFRVIAYDRPGQGYTDNPRSDAEFRRYYEGVVEHLGALLDALHIRRAHLVGHSQGGWVVTRFALDHPERTGCLVNVDATVIAPPVDIQNIVRFYQHLARDVHPAGGETAESIRQAMQLFSHTGNNITAQRVQRSLAIAQSAKFAEAKAGFNAAGLNPAHPTYRALKARLEADIDAGRLRAPSLIVWGQRDPEQSLPAALALFDRMAAAGTPVDLHVIGNAGHFPFIEYPEAFDHVVTGFCGAVPLK